MANALNTILVRNNQDTKQVFSDKTTEEVGVASGYWHPKVWSVCPGPRK